MGNRLELNQTFRHHENCGRHSQKLLADIESIINSVPILALIHAVLGHMSSEEVILIFPNADSVIMCVGKYLRYSRLIPEENKQRMQLSYMVIVFAALTEAAKAKDRTVSGTKFEEIIEECKDEYSNVDSIKDIVTVLTKIGDRFQEWE